MRNSIRIFLLVMLSIPGIAQSVSTGPDLKSLAWLVGEWSGKGGGHPGQGSGLFSFHYDLQEKVLVRKSFSEYPAAAGKAAYRHDDLMVVFKEEDRLRAIYFDNEEHVIRYTVQLSPDLATVVFGSDSPAGIPHFRLTYRKAGINTLDGKFEMAPPDKDFSTYLEWSAERQKNK